MYICSGSGFGDHYKGNGVQYIPAVPMSSYLTTSRSRVSVTPYPHFEREQAETCFPRHSLSMDRTTASIPRATIDLPPGGPTGRSGQSYLALRVDEKSNLAIRADCNHQSHPLPKHSVPSAIPDPGASTIVI